MEEQSLIEILYIYGGSFFFVCGFVIALLCINLFVKGWQSNAC